MESLDFFATHPVFTHDEYAQSRLGGPADRSPRTVDSLLRKHCAAGRIVRVRRGLYASVPAGTRPESVEVEPYLLATKVSPDATVSHHAALQFHGRAYSLWNQVTFATQESTRPFHFGGMAYVPVKLPAAAVASGQAAAGVVQMAHGGGLVRVTTLERAMVDVLHAPQLAGGWEEIWRSLETVEFFDLDAVLSYTLALNTALTVARVGLFLEQHRGTLYVEDRHLDVLAAHRPSQNRYLDASREQGRLVPRWRLIVPERVLDRTWAEVA